MRQVHRLSTSRLNATIRFRLQPSATVGAALFTVIKECAKAARLKLIQAPSDHFRYRRLPIPRRDPPEALSESAVPRPVGLQFALPVVAINLIPSCRFVLAISSARTKSSRQSGWRHARRFTRPATPRWTATWRSRFCLRRWRMIRKDSAWFECQTESLILIQLSSPNFSLAEGDRNT